MVPVLIGVVIAVFIMIKLAPGDPAAALLGVQATPQQLEVTRRAMGLDRSWPEQFGIWAFGVLHGDLGTSYINKKPVSELILTRLPVTIELASWVVDIVYTWLDPRIHYATWFWPGRGRRTLPDVAAGAHNGSKLRPRVAAVAHLAAPAPPQTCDGRPGVSETSCAPSAQMC
jgi:ABC-type microcin C transport system permease subunit YejB